MAAVAKRSGPHLTETAESGDRAATLRDLRDTLTRTIAGAEPKEIAGLSRELRIVMTELDALRTGEAGDTVDDLATRRAARRADAADQGRTAAGKQRRPRSK